MIFHTPPKNAGQIVTVSYAAVNGNVIQKTHDSNDGSVCYFIGEMLEGDEADYWNGEPNNENWRKLTFQEREEYGLEIATHTFQYRECTGFTQELEAENMDEAVEVAEELLRDGDWGDDGGWVDATVIQFDEYDDEVDSRTVNVLIEPQEPECIEDAHDWTNEGEGGLKENPGVWSIGNGAILIRCHCRNCGCIRKTITGDCNSPNCGNRDGVRYEEPECNNW